MKMYVYISPCNQNMKTLFKNAYADELLFVSSGKGILEQILGNWI